MKLGKKVIFILIFSISTLVYARISIEGSKDNVALGETFNFKVTTEKKQDYEIENIENFKLLSHYTSSNMSIINGKSNANYTDVYQIMATKEGNFKLKAVSKNEVSNSINIKVTPKNTVPISERKYFIQISPKRENYYFGEKIPYTESLITTVNIQGLNYLQKPSFGNMSIVDLNSKNKVGNTQTRIKVGNKEGVKILLSQVALEPTSSGPKEIGGSILRIATQKKDFFSQNLENLVGEKKKINVLPLPEKAPIDFKNIVGTLTGTSNLDRDTIDIGEASTLTLKLVGSGNLSNLNKILPQHNANFNIYETVADHKEWVEGNSYKNSKTFQIAFIPKKIGKLKIPEISIPYFDTVDKKYKNFIVKSREIQVNGDLNSLESKNSILPKDSSNGYKDINNGKSEKINISIIPDSPPSDTYKNWIILGLSFLVAILSGIILYLFRDIFKVKKTVNYMKKLKKSKNNDEFYKNYCEFMKKNYNFNPKIHSGYRLKDKKLQKIHHEIEKKRFKNLKIDIKKITEDLLNLPSL